MTQHNWEGISTGDGSLVCVEKGGETSYLNSPEGCYGCGATRTREDFWAVPEGMNKWDWLDQLTEEEPK